MGRFTSWLVVFAVGAWLSAAAWLWWPASPAGKTVAARERVETLGGDAVCAQCHQAIYDKYEKTSMALGSGLATDGLLTGSFEHAASGVRYKVFLRDGEGWMSYHRDGSAKAVALDGERRLQYFIGSGHRGRTYLYEEAGMWFEAPVNFYTKKALWDMAPNYGASRTMPDGLPVDPNCLHCHASQVQASLPQARNRYASVPFLQGGIGCAACHGDPAAHLAQHGKGAIVNPARLSAVKRDSTCLQCHLEGDAAIYRAGKSLADFRPGDDLSDDVDYFVKAGAEAGGGRAASQYEALSRSRCKLASGDKMTCTTCHDPHSSPSAEERVAFYRARCVACHSEPRIAVEHHPEQKDCAMCHMPTRNTVDISHEQTTDHDIRKKPSTGDFKTASGEDLTYRWVALGTKPPGDREFGLAYAQAAMHGDQAALRRSLEYLRRAETAGAGDGELHAQLGLLEQIAGEAPKAFAEYERAVAANENDNTALGNLAVLEAASGKTENAVRLLRRVVQNDPSQVAAGLNLAYIECVVGRKDEARRTLEELLRFSPDDAALNSFLREGVYAGRRCDLAVASAGGGR